MSPISTNPTFTPVTFASGDDVIALINAKFAASAEGFRRTLQASCDSAIKNFSKLAVIKALGDKLASTTAVDGGKNLMLSSDLAGSNEIKSGLQSLGLSISTEERYQIIIITYDANGSAVAGTKHLATIAEIQTAQAAAVTPSPYFDVQEYRTGKDANGKPVAYAIYRNESVLTASKTDVNSLLMALKTMAGQVETDAADDLASVRAYAEVMQRGIEDPTVKLRKREGQTVDDRLQEQRRTLLDAGRQSIEDLEFVQRSEARTSGSNGQSNGAAPSTINGGKS